jgi:hypothetical protein
VSAAGREAHHTEPVDAQSVGQRGDVGGGVEHRPARPPVRASEARAVERHEPDTEVAGQFRRGREQS